MSCKMTIEQICGAVESPLFDRKSARIDAKALAVHLIAFANADGGVIAVGVEDDGTITGIDSYAENINELLRAPFDFCKPSVRVETERLSCTNRNGKPDHIPADRSLAEQRPSRESGGRGFLPCRGQIQEAEF